MTDFRQSRLGFDAAHQLIVASVDLHLFLRRTGFLKSLYNRGKLLFGSIKINPFIGHFTEFHVGFLLFMTSMDHFYFIIPVSFQPNPLKQA